MAVWIFKKRNVAPILCAALAATGLVAPILSQPVYAQESAAGVRPGDPDVQILILPLPTGTTAISSVYPGQVPKAVAQGRVDRLLKITGWKAKNRKFSDAPAAANFVQDDTRKKLSAVSFETEETIAASDGTIEWEPFLRAFGDLRRVNIIYMSPLDYKGPTQFQSERIDFTVYPMLDRSKNPVQGSVIAAANIKTTGKDLAPFELPKFAPANPVQEKQKAVSNGNPGRRTAGVALAVTFAVLFAFIIYKWTSNYAVRR